MTYKVELYKGVRKRNYLVGFSFHKDIANFLYYADSPLKNYEYFDLGKALGIQIVSGNAGSGINIYSNEEPSALYANYYVTEFDDKNIQKVPYYPRYRALSPHQRYEYLKFLENPYQQADLGYVYLLFYCLERRLWEGKTEVIDVMKKLSDCHGERFRKAVERTLRRYSLWKSGSLYPMNVRVFYNYTLYEGCHEELGEIKG